MTSLAEMRAEWLTYLLSTAPADRPAAQAGVRRLYAAAGFNEPQHFVWFDSPFAATWAVALLVAPYHHLWSDRLRSSGLTRSDKDRIEQTRATLISQLRASDWANAQALA